MELNFSLLTNAHKATKKNFNCSIAELDDYLHHYASQDQKRKLASCWVLENSNKEILGYYTLSSEGISKEIIPDALKKNLPYEKMPVTLLGRLAVDDSYKGNGYGREILLHALKKSCEVSSKIGSAAVVVDPINEEARAFYSKYGFIPLLNERRMFLPMATIAKLF